MSLEITNHAAMRYAERIADQESLADINKYIQLHRAKIEEDINTMAEHSELIYTGRAGSKEKCPVNVFLSGTWILLLDISKSRVITLYKVDFHVGEEFNKQFIELMREKMDLHKAELENKRKEISEQRNTYLQIVKENEAQIAEFRSSIKNLEKLNADYKDIIETMDAECTSAELAVRQDVEALMRKYE